MITIIVGIPGAGKTLYAVSELRDEYQKANRQVYYYNIPGIKIDEWIELDDPTSWHTLPTGSVIIVDEAHEVFKKDNYRDKTPEHIEAAATLRHRGHDLVLLTQHPVGVDKFLRDRCGRFIYLRSPMTKGGHAFKYVWPEYQDNYKDKREWETSDQETWTHRTDAFDSYISAELHTKKKYVPKELKKAYALGIVALIGGVGIFYFLYNTWIAPTKELDNPSEYEAAALFDHAVEDIQDTVQDYFEKFVERIPGLPHSAPMYDKVTEVKTYPQYQCISNKHKCTCYTQQMSKVQMDEKQCRRIIANGYFDPSKEERG